MQANYRFVHDEAVRQCALMLAATGYQVQARVEGWFDAPPYINGYLPDIVARSGDHFIIFEVKKGEIDWPKISALEQFVNNNDSFQIRVIAPEEILAAGSNFLFDAIK